MIDSTDTILGCHIHDPSGAAQASHSPAREAPLVAVSGLELGSNVWQTKSEASLWRWFTSLFLEFTT